MIFLSDHWKGRRLNLHHFVDLRKQRLHLSQVDIRGIWSISHGGLWIFNFCCNNRALLDLEFEFEDAEVFFVVFDIDADLLNVLDARDIVIG